MDSRQKVRIIIAREEGLPLPPPFPGKGNDIGEGGKRDIPKGHKFDPNALKPLARTLFTASVALGHSVTAYREFTRIKSASISPDGMLGGKGYVLKVKEVRAKLQSACELLSAVTDTLHDELHAPHWQPEISILDEADEEDVEELIEESDEVLDDPERFGDKGLEEVEKRVPKTKGMADRIKEEGDQESDASRIPTGGSPELNEAAPPGKGYQPKEASSWKAPTARVRLANSSVPVEFMPGGPRVDHLDRAEQTGPEGSYNKDEPAVEDNWGETGGVSDEYIYTTPWENQTDRSAAGMLGQSGLPSDDATHGEANDFGIGYGAKGQGSEGYGTANPDGRGVWGPQSGLPYDPGGAVHDPEGGATPFDDKLSPSNVWASIAESGLPSDGPDPVSRSDYFDGDKGNQFNVHHHSGESQMPGRGLPAKDTPLTPRPSHNKEHMFSDSELPGDGNVTYDHDRDVTPNVGQNFEQQDVPYIKYNWGEHDYRNDQQDLYREDYH